MKHIRTFENYRVVKNREDIIKESVLQVNDIYKVKAMVDIPQSLVNSYVKKVKDNAGKNLRQFFGDVDIAEEIVKYINLNFLDVDKIPAELLMGGGQPSEQSSTEPSDDYSDVEVESTPQEEPVEPVQEEPSEEKEELELPADGDGFEAPESEDNESEDNESEDEESEDEESEDEESEDDDLLI